MSETLFDGSNIGKTPDLRYEEAYDTTIWNRKRAVEAAREGINALAAEKGLIILDESLTFTIQTVNVPPIRHSFGVRAGFSYWTIKAAAWVAVPA